MLFWAWREVETVLYLNLKNVQKDDICGRKTWSMFLGCSGKNTYIYNIISLLMFM